MITLQAQQQHLSFHTQHLIITRQNKLSEHSTINIGFLVFIAVVMRVVQTYFYDTSISLNFCGKLVSDDVIET